MGRDTLPYSLCSPKFQTTSDAPANSKTLNRVGETRQQQWNRYARQLLHCRRPSNWRVCGAVLIITTDKLLTAIISHGNHLDLLRPGPSRFCTEITAGTLHGRSYRMQWLQWRWSRYNTTGCWRVTWTPLCHINRVLNKRDPNSINRRHTAAVCSIC